MTGWEGSVAVVTGAARGLGAAVAEALHRAGWRVAVTGIEQDLLTALAARLGPRAMALEADVTDAAALHEAMATVVRHWGRIDAVISNAGVGRFGLIGSMPPDAFRRTLQVNAEGTFNAMQAALPHLLDSRGYFLCIASLAAAAAPPGLGAYGASKAAAETLADTLRAEVRHRGVAVGVAYFGWLDTDLVRAADREPAFGVIRRQLPGPLQVIGGTDRAVRAIVSGVARRRARIVAPWWLAWVLRLRWIVAADIRRFVRVMPKVDRLASPETDRQGR
jgi:NAD(P)-dependent dehydrogenase (short-subunit alcohol dehydrogenase family)